MSKLQTKEEVLANLRASIANGKIVVAALATVKSVSDKSGEPVGELAELDEEVLKNDHRLRRLTCYNEEDGEDSQGFLEVYYDFKKEGEKESLWISFNVEPNNDEPEKSVWHTYSTPIENIENFAEILSKLQQDYYDNDMFEGTVWMWKNVDLQDKVLEVKFREDE